MSKEQSKSKNICPICLAAVTNETITSACTHRFCYPCLFEWSKVFLYKFRPKIPVQCAKHDSINY